MFEHEQRAVETLIRDTCAEQGFPVPGSITWNPIPFAGQWGISTSFFQLAADEARSGKVTNVPQRAQEIAASLAGRLGTPPGFARLEAVKGYLNLYFTPGEFTRRVVDILIVADVILFALAGGVVVLFLKTFLKRRTAHA